MACLEPVEGLALRDMNVHFLSAMLTALFAQCTSEAQMKILARGMHGTMRTLSSVSIHPRTVAFMTE